MDARALAATLLTYFSWNTLVPAHEGTILCLNVHVYASAILRTYIFSSQV